MANRSVGPIVPAVRILLLDDNENGLKARKAVLEEHGYLLTTMSDPVKALELAGSQNFDLIITDYRMPAMNGTDVIAAIRKVKPQLPVILLSGFVDALGMTEENTGADAVIQKSANEVQQLVRAVSRLLRKTTARKPPGSVDRRVKARGRSAS